MLGKRKVITALIAAGVVSIIYLVMVFTGRADGVEYWLGYLVFIGTDILQYTAGNVLSKKYTPAVPAGGDK